MSSLILISHIKDGVELAKKHRLGSEIIDIIRQHHGTSLIAFFYEKAKELNGGREEGIDESFFRYPGPKPQSKESAIIMIADAVEAASRTIKEPKPEKMRAMIQKIIDMTIQDGQFADCKITISDIETITSCFLEVLSGHFHHRIQYQGLDFNKEAYKKETHKVPSGT